MSDALRKDTSSQVHDKLKPDSSKSATEQLGDNVSGFADKAASAVQPEGDKSTTQKLSDSTRGSADNAQNNSQSYVESAKQTVGNVAQAASDTLKSTADTLNAKADQHTDKTT